MHKKLIIGGLIILLLIDLALAYQSYQKSQQPDYDLVAVGRAEIVEMVSVTGAIESASQIDLAFNSSGKVTEVNVKVGDKVSAGQVLVSLDSSDLNFQAQSAQAALEIAQAKLAQLLAGASEEDIALAETAVLNAQNSLADNQKSLADAQASADNALKDVYEDTQRTLDASLLTAQNSLKTNSETLEATKLQATFSVLDTQAFVDAKNLRTLAELDYLPAKNAADSSKISGSQSEIDEAINKLKTCLDSTYNALSRTYDALVATVISSSLSQTDLDTYKSNVATARSNTNTALTNLVTAQQAIISQRITNQTNLNTAQAKVTTAQGALKTAQDQLAIKKAKPRPADIELYQSQVKQAQANLAQIRNQITQKTLTAPIGGLITNVAIELGEAVSLNEVVVSMESLADFEIEASIPETDIAKVALGNPVEITFDALGNWEVFQGKITKIDPAQTEVQGVIYYKTTVGLIGNDSRIKSGMTANLEIETARVINALIVPSRAISETNGKKLVKVLADNQIKEKVVETGLKNDQGEIQILSGLNEGEKVVIEKGK